MARVRPYAGWNHRINRGVAELPWVAIVRVVCFVTGALSGVQELVTVVDSWPQVVGLLVLALAFLGYQIVKGNRATARVEKTLTSNNGGSHVKDALDRIEVNLKEVADAQALQEERLQNLEAGAKKRFMFLR